MKMINYALTLILSLHTGNAWAQEQDNRSVEPGPKVITIENAQQMTNGQITTAILSNGGIAIGFCSLKVAADIADYIARFGNAAKRAAQESDDKRLKELVEQFNKDMEIANQDRYVAGEDQACKQAVANIVTFSKVVYERTSARLK